MLSARYAVATRPYPREAENGDLAVVLPYLPSGSVTLPGAILEVAVSQQKENVPAMMSLTAPRTDGLLSASPYLWVGLFDGAGHGPAAAHAATAARTYLHDHRLNSIVDMLIGIHGLLHGTRGAVGALAKVDLAAAQLEYGGVGNIECRLLRANGPDRYLISYNGLLGYTMPHVRTFTHPLVSGDLLVIHSDGVSAAWGPSYYPGLQNEPPDVVANIILRDWGRQTDDATVLAMHFASSMSERTDKE